MTAPRHPARGLQPPVLGLSPAAVTHPANAPCQSGKHPALAKGHWGHQGQTHTLICSQPGFTPLTTCHRGNLPDSSLRDGAIYQ